LLFRGVGGDLVGELDEAVEVVGVGRGHPGAAVDEGGLDHLEFLAGDHLQPRLDVLSDVALELAVAEPHDGRDHVVVAVGSSTYTLTYMLSPRYSRAVG